MNPLGNGLIHSFGLNSFVLYGLLLVRSIALHIQGLISKILKIVVSWKFKSKINNSLIYKRCQLIGLPIMKS